MDAAQMLTAQEIARECERMANLAERPEHRSGSAPGTSENQVGNRPHVSLVDPITQPIPRITEPRRPEHDSVPDDGALTERERGILAFERQWWKRSGSKENAVRELFEMSVSRYYQVLNAIVDKPEAYRADPMLIKRLRKVRGSRQRARAARRLGIELH